VIRRPAARPDDGESLPAADRLVLLRERGGLNARDVAVAARRHSTDDLALADRQGRTGRQTLRPARRA
jgi:hypothetical protein